MPNVFSYGRPANAYNGEVWYEASERGGDSRDRVKIERERQQFNKEHYDEQNRDAIRFIGIGNELPNINNWNASIGRREPTLRGFGEQNSVKEHNNQLRTKIALGGFMREDAFHGMGDIVIGREQKYYF
tara:strand:- start:180 stop:566 length:387 start_codon:yes stop_codon:yes gene_type:complete